MAAPSSRLWPAQTGFPILFWTDAVTGALFGILIWRLVPEPACGVPGASPNHGGYRRVIRDRTMVAFTVAVTVYYFVSKPPAALGHLRSSQ